MQLQTSLKLTDIDGHGNKHWGTMTSATNNWKRCGKSPRQYNTSTAAIFHADPHSKSYTPTHISTHLNHALQPHCCCNCYLTFSPLLFTFRANLPNFFSELFEQRLPGNKWILSRQDLGKSRESIQVLPKTPRRTFSLPNRLLAGGNNWCLPPHSPNREIKPYVRRCQKTVELQLRR